MEISLGRLPTVAWKTLCVSHSSHNLDGDGIYQEKDSQGRSQKIRQAVSGGGVNYPDRGGI